MINELLKTKKELRFKNGKLKIAMFSDIHGKTGYSKRLKYDFEAAIKAAKPDIVLLGGDQVGGKKNCNSVEDFKEFLTDITEVLERNEIPWAHVYGNHDEETISKEEQEAIYESFEYCVSKSGPDDIGGVGNYFLPIKASEGDDVVFGIWGLDSGRSVRGANPDLNLKHEDIMLPNNFGCTEYGHVKVGQVAWYYESSMALEKHFGKKIPSLMYFHIPVPEYLLVVRNPERTGMVGDKREEVACSEHNPGLFAAALSRADIKAMCCGHDHINDFCGEYCGIKLCYDGGMSHSENSYWHPDMLGGRIFEISEDAPWNVNTYMFRLRDVIPAYDLTLDEIRAFSKNLALKKELRFKDGKFKVALFSDLHGGKVYDKRLKRDFDAMVKGLNPDLVLFSGDVFDLDAELRTEEEIRAFLDEITEVLEKNNIPWANVYGNHEREGAIPNAELQPIFESYPNCLSKAGPKKLRGTGNYMLPIKATEGDMIKFNIWGFDSGCTVDICDWEHPNFKEAELKLPNPLFNGKGYDNPKFDQIMWYYSTSEALEVYNGEKVPSFMFFHIPIPEHLMIAKNPVETGMEGVMHEDIACSELDNGVFAAALLRGDVKGIFCGHDHINDFCGEYCGIKLGYNAALCYDCYNEDDMRGCRVFEIDENDAWNFKTYIARAKDFVPDYGI